MPGKKKKTKDEVSNQCDSSFLLGLQEEVFSFSDLLKQTLTHSPENLQAHNVYRRYVGTILDIRKTMIHARSVDQETLLIDALRSVVLTLIEGGETGAAEFIGDHLDEIGEKVREQWQQTNKPGWQKAIKKSEPLSGLQFLPSAKPLLRKRKNAKKKR